MCPVPPAMTMRSGLRPGFVSMVFFLVPVRSLLEHVQLSCVNSPLSNVSLESTVRSRTSCALASETLIDNLCEVKRDEAKDYLPDALRARNCSSLLAVHPLGGRKRAAHTSARPRTIRQPR